LRDGRADDGERPAPGRKTVPFFIVDSSAAVVREVDPQGMIITIAGVATTFYNGDNIPANNAALDGPQSVAVDSAGDLCTLGTRVTIGFAKC
jgi:hypothetical protein